MLPQLCVVERRLLFSYVGRHCSRLSCGGLDTENRLLCCSLEGTVVDFLVAVSMRRTGCSSARSKALFSHVRCWAWFSISATTNVSLIFCVTVLLHV